MTSLSATPVGMPKVFPLSTMPSSTFQNGLNLNPNKCVQCTFSLIGNVVTDPDLKATINDNALSTVDTVTCLGGTFARNANWTNHVEGIFRKCVRLCFFAKKLRRLSTPAEYIRKFAEACVIPIILYCSPAIFPGLLKQDFALLRRSIKLISNVCGLRFQLPHNSRLQTSYQGVFRLCRADSCRQ